MVCDSLVSYGNRRKNQATQVPAMIKAKTFSFVTLEPLVNMTMLSYFMPKAWKIIIQYSIVGM